MPTPSSTVGEAETSDVPKWPIPISSFYATVAPQSFWPTWGQCRLLACSRSCSVLTWFQNSFTRSPSDPFDVFPFHPGSMEFCHEFWWVLLCQMKDMFAAMRRGGSFLCRCAWVFSMSWGMILEVHCHSPMRRSSLVCQGHWDLEQK